MVGLENVANGRQEMRQEICAGSTVIFGILGLAVLPWHLLLSFWVTSNGNSFLFCLNHSGSFCHLRHLFTQSRPTFGFSQIADQIYRDMYIYTLLFSNLWSNTTMKCTVELFIEFLPAFVCTLLLAGPWEPNSSTGDLDTVLLVSSHLDVRISICVQ